MPQLRVAHVAEGHVVSPAAHDRDGERSRAINTHVHTYTKQMVETRSGRRLKVRISCHMSSIIVCLPSCLSYLHFLREGDIFSTVAPPVCV